MQYIKPENLIFHSDALVTLEVLREHTLGCEGDEAVRLGILNKIDARIAELKASVFQRTEADGTIRVRHPAIGVMSIDHETLKAPTQLFASHVKSLVAFTITISRADAIIDVDGLIDYEPYEELARLKMTSAAFNEMMTSPGRGHHPATFEFAKHYRIDPYLPDALANSKTLLSQSLENCLLGTQEWLGILTGLITEAADKPAKPTVKAVANMQKYTSMLEGSVVSGPAFGLARLAEFAEVVKAHSRQEVEALIAFHKMNEGSR